MNQCNRISMIYADHWGCRIKSSLDSGVTRCVRAQLLDQVNDKLVAIDVIIESLKL
jgi:hypothetical protein